MSRLLINGYYHSKASPVLSSSTASSSLTGRRRSLEDALPLLQERFDRLADAQGVLPLLTEQQYSTLFRKHQWSKQSGTSERSAAVLVLVCWLQGEPSIVFTRRAAHMSTHASEISFPGGHMEAQDENVMATALREAREELLPGNDLFLLERDKGGLVDILGQASPLPALRGTPVTPVLAVCQEPLEEASLASLFPGDPCEVEQVFGTSISQLVQVEQSRPLPPNKFRLARAPVYPTPEGEIWGLTAMILQPLLQTLFRPVFVDDETVEQ